MEPIIMTITIIMAAMTLDIATLMTMDRLIITLIMGRIRIQDMIKTIIMITTTTITTEELIIPIMEATIKITTTMVEIMGDGDFPSLTYN